MRPEIPGENGTSAVDSQAGRRGFESHRPLFAGAATGKSLVSRAIRTTGTGDTSGKARGQDRVLSDLTARCLLPGWAAKRSAARGDHGTLDYGSRAVAGRQGWALGRRASAEPLP